MLLVTATSCDDNWDPTAPKAQGTLDFASLQLEMPADATVPAADFTITVADEQGAHVFTRHDFELPATLQLPEGDYTLSATNMPSPSQAWWDVPYYLGSKQVTIDRRKTTQASTLPIRMACIGVTVAYELPDDQKPLNLATTVYYGVNTALTFDSAGRWGYFLPQADATTLMAVTTAEINGVAYLSRQFINSVQTGQTYTFTVTQLTPSF